MMLKQGRPGINSLLGLVLGYMFLTNQKSTCVRFINSPANSVCLPGLLSNWNLGNKFTLAEKSEIYSNGTKGWKRVLSDFFSWKRDSWPDLFRCLSIWMAKRAWPGAESDVNWTPSHTYHIDSLSAGWGGIPDHQLLRHALSEWYLFPYSIFV